MRLTLERLASLVLPRADRGGVLSSSERRTLVSVAEVLMLTTTRDAPHGLSAEEIVDNIERFLISGRSRRTWRVRILTRIIELSPLPRFRRPFSRLTLGERRIVVTEEWIAGHRLGRICGKAKNLVVLGAYGDPRAAAKTGYVPVDRRRRFTNPPLVHADPSVMSIAE